MGTYSCPHPARKMLYLSAINGRYFGDRQIVLGAGCVVLAQIPFRTFIPMQLNEKYDDRPGTAGERIIAILGGAELERAWKECLAVWENSSPAQRADCRAFVVHLRDGFVRVLRDVDDAQVDGRRDGA